MRNDDGSGQGGSSGDGEKWSDSGTILKKSQKNLPTAWIWDVREKDQSRITQGFWHMTEVREEAGLRKDQELHFGYISK